MTGQKKIKSWLPARQVVQAGNYPQAKNSEDFTRAKLVFGFNPKTILR
jgi:hypothetical protein